MGLNGLGLGFTVSAEDTASAVFNQVGGNLTKLEKKGHETGASLEEVSGKIASMGTALAGFGAAGVASLGLASNAAADFQTSIAQITTIADEAAFTTDGLRDSVFSMGQQFGGDLKTQAAALYSAIGSGAETAADATSLLESSNKLAIGGITTTDVAMTGLLGTLNAYGMALTNSMDVSDAFFATVKLGGSDLVVGKLADGLGRVAPSAAAMNVELKDLLGSIAQLTSVGIKTDEAITGMKAIFDQILKPTSDAAAEAKRLGIEFNSATLKTKGFQQFMLDIIDSPGRAGDSLEKLFGGSSLALNAVGALASNRGKFVEFIQQIGNSAGATDEAFEKLAATGNFAMSVLKSNFQQAAVKAGEIVLPIFIKFGEVLNGILVAFNKLPAPARKIIVGLFALAAGAALVVGGLLLAVSAVMGLMAASGALEAALAAVGVVVLNLAVLMAPLIAVGATLFALWKSNAGGFADIVSGAIHKVQLAFEGLSQLLSTGQLSGNVLKEMNNGQQGVKNFVITIFLWIARAKNFITGIGEGFEIAMARAKPVLDAFGAALKRIGALFGFLQNSPEENANAFLKWGDSGMKLGQIIGNVVEIIVKGFTMAANFVEGAVRAFQFFWPVVSKTWDVVKGLFGAIGEIIGALLGVDQSTGATGDSMRTFGMVIGAVASALGVLANIALTVTSVTLSIISGLVTSVRAMIMLVVESISGQFDFIIALLTGDWAGAWQAAQGIVISWAKAIVNIIAGVVLAIAGAIDKIGKAFGKDFGLRDKVQGVQTEIVDSLQKTIAKPAPGQGAPPPGPAGAAPPSTATPVTPGGVAPGVAAPPPPSPGNAPGVAAGAGQAELTGAVKQLAAQQAKPPPPVNATIHVPVNLDGQQIADVVAKYNGDGRDLSPKSPPP